MCAENLFYLVKLESGNYKSTRSSDTCNLPTLTSKQNLRLLSSMDSNMALQFILLSKFLAAPVMLEFQEFELKRSKENP